MEMQFAGLASKGMGFCFGWFAPLDPFLGFSFNF